jgi:hypothetical protein
MYLNNAIIKKRSPRANLYSKEQAKVSLVCIIENQLPAGPTGRLSMIEVTVMPKRRDLPQTAPGTVGGAASNFSAPHRCDFRVLHSIRSGLLTFGCVQVGRGDSPGKGDRAVEPNPAFHSKQRLRDDDQKDDQIGYRTGRKRLDGQETSVSTRKGEAPRS